MKQLILSILIVAASDLFAQKNYVVNGAFSEPTEEKWIYVTKYNGNQIIDSARIVEGKFVLKGNVDFPEVHVLHYHQERITGFTPFFLEEGEITITINPEDWDSGSVVKGGKVNQDYEDWQIKIEKSFRDRKTNLYKMLQSDKDNPNIKAQIEELNKEHSEVVRKYILDNSGNPISLFILSKYLRGFELDQLKEVLIRFPLASQQTTIYRSIKKYYDFESSIRDARALSYTDVITNINVKYDENSVLRAISKLYPNKVIFIDIWGPWCAPCIEEFPFQQKLQAKLNPDKIVFVFLGFKSPEPAWREMIEKKKLKGEHFLLNKQLEDILQKEVPDLNGIPRYFIIDSTGKLVNAKAPRPSSPDLETELAKWMK